MHTGHAMIAVCTQTILSCNTQHKLTLRQGFVSTGMGDLQSKLLTVAEAKKRKADADVYKRKQRNILEAEQPKTIECAT